MERLITGFHEDEAGDLVAELACGHDQHVRHAPPFQLRPWVLTEAGRTARMAVPIDCPLCERFEPPANLTLTRTSPEWTEATMPAGLRKRHRLAVGGWGRITVLQGRLSLSSTNGPHLDGS